MLDSDWLTYRQEKTGNVVCAPMPNAAPAYAEPSTHLAEALAAIPTHLLFLTTRAGRGRSAKAAASWFSKKATDAGIDKSAHGLRKLRAEILRENGATADQRMAWLGHKSATESDYYSEGADAKRIIAGTKSSNAPATGSNGTRKTQ